MMWGADGWWWGWIMMATIWVGIVLFAVWAIRNGGRRGDPSDPSQAERTLDERFARGEIDADEYETRIKVLHNRA